MSLESDGQLGRERREGARTPHLFTDDDETRVGSRSVTRSHPSLITQSGIMGYDWINFERFQYSSYTLTITTLTT